MHTLAHAWHTSTDYVCDLVFPKHCLGCGEMRTYLCRACIRRLPRAPENHCPICRRPTPSGEVCLACRPRTSLDGLLVALPHHPVLDRVIHAFKYRFVEELSAPLSNLLLEKIGSANWPLPDCIVPVPLHAARLRWRDFNQAELLARLVERRLAPGLPLPILTENLIRVRATPSQTGRLSREERLENLQGAFAWQSTSETTLTDVASKRVWLIDDVATTLATLEECAKVLKKQAKAREVWGLVITR